MNRDTSGFPVWVIVLVALVGGIMIPFLAGEAGNTHVTVAQEEAACDAGSSEETVLLPELDVVVSVPRPTVFMSESLKDPDYEIVEQDKPLLQKIIEDGKK